MFFYKLITSAWRLNIPVVDISKLMRLPSTDIPNYIRDNFPSSLVQAPGVLNKLLNMTLTSRDQKIHGRGKYDPPNGTSLTDYILQKKLSLFTSINCGSYLKSISQFCERSISGCDTFNAYYFDAYEHLSSVRRSSILRV